MPNTATQGTCTPSSQRFRLVFEQLRARSNLGDCHLFPIQLFIALKQMSNSRPSKRRRKNATIGAPSEADSASNQINSPLSSALSTRTLPTTAYGIPSLTTLCARVFISSFSTFSSNPHIWEPRERWGPVKKQLKSFPDSIVSKIFAMLRMTCPHLLSHDLVREVCVCPVNHSRS